MSGSKYQQCLASLFKTTQEGYIIVQEWATNTFLRASHYCLHSFRSAQPKDTSTKFLLFAQIHVLLHGFKSDATKVPIPNAYLSFYMPLFLQLSIIFFCHHSLASTFYNLYFSQGLLAYHGVVTGAIEIINYQHNQSILLSPKSDKKKKNKKNLLASLPNSASYFASQCLTTQTSIECCNSLHHPQLNVDLFS